MLHLIFRLVSFPVYVYDFMETYFVRNDEMMMMLLNKYKPRYV